jgi:hypothetical protein
MSELPVALCEFVHEHIETLEELEVLVLLAREPDRALTAADAEQKIGFPSSSFSAALQRLCRSELCDVHGEVSERGYVLTRRHPLLRSRAVELAQLYDTERFAIIKLVADAALARIRGSMGKAFADAFVLGKKGKRDG